MSYSLSCLTCQLYDFDRLFLTTLNLSSSVRMPFFFQSGFLWSLWGHSGQLKKREVVVRVWWIPGIITTVQPGLLEAGIVRLFGLGLLFSLSKAVCHGITLQLLLAIVFSSPSCRICTPFVVYNGYPSPAFLYVIATSFLFLIKEIKLIKFLRTSPAHLFQPGYVTCICSIWLLFGL